MLERQREIEAINAAFAAGRGSRGSVVLIEAPAGLGKTTLLRHALDAARRDDFAVATATGSEFEQSFPFGIAQQLFEGQLRRLPADARGEVLSGAASPAAVIVDVARAPDVPLLNLDQNSLLHGLYWLTANLADGSPLVIAVDDAQWADAESLLFLHFLARRLEEIRVVVIVAARPTADAGVLDSLRTPTDAVHLRLAELTEEAVRAVLSEEFATEPEDAFVKGCRDATGGNPFFVRELARALRDAGAEPTHAHVDSLEETTAPTIGRNVSRRIDYAGEGARDVAEAVAVLGDPAPISLVARLTRTDEQRAADAADRLEKADILLSGPELRFSHPVIRTAVYDELGRARRAEEHSRAAEVLLESGASAERVAAHVMLAAPTGDSRRVAALRAAARSARARGAPKIAAAQLERALNEPPPAAELQPVLVELGAARVAAGDWTGRAHLERALELAQSADEHADALRELVQCVDLYFEGAETRERLWHEIDELQRTQPELAVRLEAIVAATAWFDPSDETLDSIGRRLARVTAGLTGRSLAERALLIHAAGHRWQREEIGAPEAVDVVADALRTGLPPDALTLLLGIGMLNSAERFDLSLPIVERALDDARKNGQVTTLAVAMIGRADAMWIQGRLRFAEADAEAARGALEGAMNMEAQPRALIAQSLIDQGRLDGADAAIDPFREQLETDPPGAWFGPVLWSRGCLRLAQGRHDEALADLRRVAANPAGAPSRELWRPSAVEALLGAGRRDDALALAYEAVEFAAPRAAWHQGLALTALGRALGRDGLATLEQAVEVLETSAARLLHAKALLALGELLRRSRRPADAREPLGRALEIAHECGAHPVEERARQELQAAGLRPRRVARTGIDALTASELRVAQLAARGMSNPEIAQSLFVTRKTVEAHLRGVFRKLDLTSRHELAQIEALQPQDG